ncbi:hypothetical protein KI387_020765, partial [Taxus chinensis]
NEGGRKERRYDNSDEDEASIDEEMTTVEPCGNNPGNISSPLNSLLKRATT